VFTYLGDRGYQPVIAYRETTKPPFLLVEHSLEGSPFSLLHVAGRLIAHGRRLYLKIAHGHPCLPLYQEGRKKLLAFSSA
jgi:hypothetical protein